MESVLITGASRGIGAGIARRLAANGFNLVLWARAESDLKEIANECSALGVSVRTAVVDVSNSDTVTTAGAASLEGIDGLRGCVVNAGTAAFDRLSDLSTDDWRETLGTNLDGAFFTLRAALPLLQRCLASQVVAMGSQSGLYAFETQAAYAASKWGLHGLVEIVRRESRTNGVRVTNLVMGPVDTFFRDKQPGDRPGTLSIDEVASVVETVFALPPTVEIRELQLTSVRKPFGPFPEHHAGD